MPDETKTQTPAEPTTPVPVPEPATPVSDTVAMKDFLVVKSQKEGLQTKLTEAETMLGEIPTLKSNLSDAQQKQFAAEARVTGLEATVAESAGSITELASTKQELERALVTAKEAGDKSLEYRRALLAGTYGIALDTIKDKTVEQLDAYEDALKAVKGNGGAGNFALPGAGGGQGTPQTQIERANQILAEHDRKKAGGGSGGGGSPFDTPPK